MTRNCVWCPNGGNQPSAVGPICKSCAEEIAEHLEEDAPGVTVTGP